MDVDRAVNDQPTGQWVDAPAIPHGVATDSAGEGSGRPCPSAEPDGLTEREVALLDFERRWWRSPGSKETALRRRFEFSPTRYYQLLNVLIDSEAALRYDPLLVKRLRRARFERRRARSRALRSPDPGVRLPGVPGQPG